MDKTNFLNSTIHTLKNCQYTRHHTTISVEFPNAIPSWLSNIEIFIVQKGSAIFTVNNQQYHLYENHILVIEKGSTYSTTDFLSQIPPQNPLQTTSPLPLHINTNLSIHKTLLTYLENIDTYNSQKPFGYQLVLKGSWLSIIGILLSLGHYQKSEINHNNGKLEHIHLYVEQNFHRPISIQEIADEVGFSQSHFMRYFKQLVGITWVDYLNNYRLEKSVNLLHQTDKNILSIALDCGFGNLSYFNRLFKRKYDKTPSQYRKSLLN